MSTGRLLSSRLLRRYLLLGAAIFTALCSVYLLVSAAGICLLPAVVLADAGDGPIPGLVGASLLVIDAFLPIPSSLVMIAQGARYGMVGGTVLSVAGGVGCSVAGFYLGRFARGFVQRTSAVARQGQRRICLRAGESWQ